MSEWLHGIKGLIAVLGSLVTVVGSLVGILIATNVINVGGGGQPENKPPVVGSIFLENPVAVPGQSTRAEITVSDPDRDTLDIRWTANSGSFDQGNTGSSVIYQPPAVGASVQLTVEVSDGINPPVRVSENFRLAIPSQAQVVSAPPPLAPNPAPIIPPAESPTKTPTPTPTPPPDVFNLTGRWDSVTGHVEFVLDRSGDYSYADFDLLGNTVGSGTAYIEGKTVFIEGVEIIDDGFGNLTPVAYYGELVLSGDVMAGDLYDSVFDIQLGSVQFIRDRGGIGR